jgi:hypothetical protein
MADEEHAPVEGEEEDGFEELYGPRPDAQPRYPYWANKTRLIRFRRGDAQQWAEAEQEYSWNTVLGSGEPAVEINPAGGTSVGFKIGTGSHQYSELPFIFGPGGDVQAPDPLPANPTGGEIVRVRVDPARFATAENNAIGSAPVTWTFRANTAVLPPGLTVPGLPAGTPVRIIRTVNEEYQVTNWYGEWPPIGGAILVRPTRELWVYVGPNYWQQASWRNIGTTWGAWEFIGGAPLRVQGLQSGWANNADGEWYYAGLSLDVPYKMTFLLKAGVGAVWANGPTTFGFVATDEWIEGDDWNDVVNGPYDLGKIATVTSGFGSALYNWLEGVDWSGAPLSPPRPYDNFDDLSYLRREPTFGAPAEMSRIMNGSDTLDTFVCGNTENYRSWGSGPLIGGYKALIPWIEITPYAIPFRPDDWPFPAVAKAKVRPAKLPQRPELAAKLAEAGVGPV